MIVNKSFFFKVHLEIFNNAVIIYLRFNLLALKGSTFYYWSYENSILKLLRCI